MKDTIIPFPPINTEKIFEAAKKENNGNILLKSEDTGFSWTQIDWQKWLQVEQGKYTHKLTNLCVDPQSSNTLFITVRSTTNEVFYSLQSDYFHLLKTSDGGNTWKDITQGMCTTVESIWSLSKLLNSKDRTQMAHLLLSSSNSVAIDPFNSKIIYITTSKGGFYRTDDGGITWKSPGNYLKDLVNGFDNYWTQKCKDCQVNLKIINSFNVSFNNIAINPSDSKILYLATNMGVYKSYDHGDTWQLLNNGLLGKSVNKVMTSSDLVVAEGENGIYILTE